MKYIINTIKSIGLSNSLLILMLALACILILVYNFTGLIPIDNNDSITNLALALTLSALATLLFVNLTEKNREFHIEGLSESGISTVLNGMKGKQLDELMSASGKKIILNTWIYNLPEISPLLNQSLKNTDTTIDFYVLDPESEFVKIRAEELNRNVKSAIESNLDELSLFVKQANSKNVNIHLYDSAPKITLYSSNQKAITGFFWHGFHAAHGPQFLIERNSGNFSSCIWDYFEVLKNKSKPFEPTKKSN